jgi:hypothetical protein
MPAYRSIEPDPPVRKSMLPDGRWLLASAELSLVTRRPPGLVLVRYRCSSYAISDFPSWCSGAQRM